MYNAKYQVPSWDHVCINSFVRINHSGTPFMSFTPVRGAAVRVEGKGKERIELEVRLTNSSRNIQFAEWEAFTKKKEGEKIYYFSRKIS